MAKQEAAPSSLMGLLLCLALLATRGIPTRRLTLGVADQTHESYCAVAAGSATRQMPRPCVAA
jgi:hypothetical protein